NAFSRLLISAPHPDDRCVCCSLMAIARSSFSFNASAAPEIYTLSLHDALPICDLHLADGSPILECFGERQQVAFDSLLQTASSGDRKSTRLNSSHVAISYAVFCLKKNKMELPGAAVAHANRRHAFLSRHALEHD